MVVTLILGICCLIANFIGYFLKNDWGLKFSFLLIFLFLGLRYEFGNDYEVYFELFNRIKENQDIAFEPSMYIFYEPGWMLLNWVCRPIGFFGMTMLIALFYSFTFFRLIKKYIPQNYFWLSIFFIVFNPGFLLVHSTAMRQMIAILIFFYAIDFIIEKKIFKSILLILLASLFHYTSLLIILTLPFLFYSGKINFIWTGILFLSYLMIFTFGPLLTPYLGSFLTFFSDRYEVYSEKGTANSGLGFIFYSTLFLLTLILARYQDDRTSIYFKLSIVYFMLMPFTLIIEMIARFGMYFAPSSIVSYIFIERHLFSLIFRYVFLFVIILFTLYQFFQFFYSDTYQPYFMIYRSIFSSSKWY